MILCCGEALIDMIPTDQPTGQPAYVPHTGGAIFNTAIALGRLGVDAALLSGVSTDPFGVMLADALRENGVSTRYLVRSDRLTTLAIVHLENGSARYSFYDENSAGRALLPEDMPPLPDTARALYGGGISLVATPAADAYAALLTRERGNRIAMIDPNIRTGFITDEPAYRDRIAHVISQSDIVKVSDEDLDWLCPGPATMVQKATMLRTSGPTVVIVTQGATGVTAFYRDKTLTVPAIATDVVDTVGAGDTFNAGFLAGLEARDCLTKTALGEIPEDTLYHALLLGTRVAAITVSRPGANPPFAAELAQ